MNKQKAFPTQPYTIDTPRGEVMHSEGSEGMDLRDYFAGLAMSAYLSRIDKELRSERTLARDSYKIADAMMEARNVQEDS